MEIKKSLRTVGIIVVILAIIWLVANWSVVSTLYTLGFHLPVKEFVIFGLGYVTCFITKKINEECHEGKAVKAKGTAQVESAKADMIEHKKKVSPVKVARARKRANVASARADAIEA